MKHHRLAIFFTAVSLTALMVLNVPVFGQENIKVTAGNVYPGEVDMKAFTLTKDTRVKLDGALGLFHYRGSELVFYGWILDTNTRKVVWHMVESKDRGRYDRGITHIKETLSLPRGDYEIYYAAASNRSERVGDSPNVVSKIISSIFDIDRREYTRKFRDELVLTVSGKSPGFVRANALQLVKAREKQAILSITRTENDRRVQKAFALTKETRVRIYALGEGSESTSYDYGWIDDIKTNKRVWTMSGRKAESPGGAEKNILADEEITLPPGQYLVHYTTDDSHSYQEWNSLPPDDPQFWGITIWPVSDKDLANAASLENFQLPKPVIELTKVRDGEHVSRGIMVNKPMDLRVLCVGEGNKEGRMYDHGWIENAYTREKVWEMKGRSNDHAGGGQKNRKIDEVIHLDKGNYIVKYVTDDSHSYRDWNTIPPAEPERWGITLWVTDEKDRDSIQAVESDQFVNQNVIVKIIRVMDDSSFHKPFTLTEDTRIRILAVGEGASRRMVDYGWIEEKERGDIVWKMKYRDTRHAGGAEKNRLFTGTLELRKGDYELHYVTDGSHSYMDWNAAPPDDQDIYGITLLREK